MGLLLQREVEFCQRFFCIYWGNSVTFILDSIYVVYFVYWFAFVEPCFRPGMKPTWSWCMIFLMCHSIQVISILLRIFISKFIKDIGLKFFCLFALFCIVVPLPHIGIRMILSSYNEFGSTPSPTISCTSLRSPGVSYSLKAW